MNSKNKLLIFSLIALNIYTWVISAEIKLGIPRIIKYVLALFVIGTIFYNRFKYPSKPSPEGSFYPVIMAFSLWSIVLVILVLLKFDGMIYIQRVFGQPYFFIPYIIPVLILYTKFDLKFFSNFFYYVYLLIIPSLLIQLYIILFSISLEEYELQVTTVGLFNIGSSFLLLTAHISKKKYISYIVLFYYLIWTLMWSYYGRRGMLIENIILLLSFVIIRLRSPFLKMTDRMMIYFSGLVLIILFLGFGYLFMSSYAFQRGMSKSGFYESRGVVIEDFFNDFNTASDWIFGRGLDGKVFRSINLEEGSSGVIENGFLTVILKGGLLYLIPFILILLRASYLGFFKSNNDLSKALASLVLIYVIMMLYFNLPSFSLRYFFLWISVSVCFTPEIRNNSNEEISLAINSRFTWSKSYKNLN